MKYRALAVLPLLLALVLAVTSLSAGSNMVTALRVGDELGKVLSVAGALAAAMAFERGEYLNRAWLIYGSCYVLLLVNDGLRISGVGGESMVLARGLIVAAANGCSVTGTWMLARAWSVAGLDEEGSDRGRRRLMFAGAAVLALAITGWLLVGDVRALIAGDTQALISIASDLGDTFTLALVAPVMHTALAMRGGLLRWPWGLLTASGVAWIAYDASSGLVDARHLGPGLALVASESLRVMANGWVFSAGVAQRLALTPDEPPSPLAP